MINKINIKNFKSVKDLTIDCSRVNIFIGEPNTGKSNILEAMSLFSLIHDKTKNQRLNSIINYLRAEDMTNLFYNNIIDVPITVDCKGSLGHDIFTINFIRNEFELICSDIKNVRKLIEIYLNKDFKNLTSPQINFYQSLPIRFYRFKNINKYPSKEIDFLNPPYGDNLLKIIQTRKEIKDFVIDLFSDYGYKYQAFDDLNKIYFNLNFNGELVPLPFRLLSDTLLRIIFYFSAIGLSKDATILLEEPEAHVFPFYNKFLAEKIALYNSNQFFIATHNPTFLLNLIEKTPDEELNVFITYYDKNNYQTNVKLLKGKETESLLQYGNSLFMNLDKYYENE